MSGSYTLLLPIEWTHIRSQLWETTLFCWVWTCHLPLNFCILQWSERFPLLQMKLRRQKSSPEFKPGVFFFFFLIQAVLQCTKVIWILILFWNIPCSPEQLWVICKYNKILLSSTTPVLNESANTARASTDANVSQLDASFRFDSKPLVATFKYNFISVLAS